MKLKLVTLMNITGVFKMGVGSGFNVVLYEIVLIC